MRDASRKFGDVSTFKSSSGTYVVLFKSRDNNHYPTANISQILVKPEAIDKSQYANDSSSDAYNAAVAKANPTAKDTASKIYDEWTKGGSTEDQLTQLMTSHATEISTADSKQMTSVYKTQLPKEVNDWLYDPARKTGDHAMLYNADTGYYIVYFEGQGKQYSDVLADKDKRDKDLKSWQDSLTGSDPTTTWLLSLSA